MLRQEDVFEIRGKKHQQSAGEKESGSVSTASSGRLKQAGMILHDNVMYAHRISDGLKQPCASCHPLNSHHGATPNYPRGGCTRISMPDPPACPYRTGAVIRIDPTPWETTEPQSVCSQFNDLALASFCLDFNISHLMWKWTRYRNTPEATSSRALEMHLSTLITHKCLLNIISCPAVPHTQTQPVMS